MKVKTVPLVNLVKDFEYNLEKTKKITDLDGKVEEIKNVILLQGSNVNKKNNPLTQDYLYKELICLRSLRRNLIYKEFGALKDRIELINDLLLTLNRYIFSIEEHLQKKYLNSGIEGEKNDIEKGLYQELTYLFTYSTKHALYTGYWNVGYQGNSFVLQGLVNLNGLRCTIAIPSRFKSPLVNVYVNFFGTVDFASLISDLEKWGPGQKTIRIYALILLSQIHSVFQQLSNLYPDYKFKLILMGHSLGGALAKNCAYFLQKAIALQNNTVDQIIEEIEEQFLRKNGQAIPEDLKLLLREELNEDSQKFSHLDGLKNIEGITIYAWGSPGVPEKVNQLGGLMSYFYPEDFMRIYNQFHKVDLIPRFGETEFLVQTKNGFLPNIRINKFIRYDVALSEEEIKSAEALPFSGCSKKVMAAHNKHISKEKEVVSEWLDSPIKRKTFSKVKRLPYELFHGLMVKLENTKVVESLAKKIPSLRSWETTPNITINLQELNTPFTSFFKFGLSKPYSESSSDSESFDPLLK